MFKFTGESEKEVIDCPKWELDAALKLTYGLYMALFKEYENFYKLSGNTLKIDCMIKRKTSRTGCVSLTGYSSKWLTMEPDSFDSTADDLAETIRNITYKEDNDD